MYRWQFHLTRIQTFLTKSIKRSRTKDTVSHTQSPLSLKILEVAVERLEPGAAFDKVHISRIRNPKLCYHNLICKFFDKLISLPYYLHGLLQGHIRLTMKNSSGIETDSKNYRPVMISSICLNILEYILLQYLEKPLLVHQNQFAYRPTAGCIDAITVIKETVMYYNFKLSDV